MKKLTLLSAVGLAALIAWPIVAERTRAIPQDVWTGAVSPGRAASPEPTQEARDAAMRAKMGAATPSPTPAQNAAMAVAVVAVHINTCETPLSARDQMIFAKLKAAHAYSNDELAAAVGLSTGFVDKIGKVTWCADATKMLRGAR
jgi:hypothetical protein